jgi:hypothetical protein
LDRKAEIKEGQSPKMKKCLICNAAALSWEATARTTQNSAATPRHPSGGDNACDGRKPRPFQPRPHLLLLKPLLSELARSAVLGDGAYDVIWRTGGNVSLDLQRHSHRRSNQADQMGDDLLGEPNHWTPTTVTSESDRMPRTAAFG